MDPQVEAAAEALQKTRTSAKEVLGYGLSALRSPGTRGERYPVLAAGHAHPLDRPMRPQALAGSLF